MSSYARPVPSPAEMSLLLKDMGASFLNVATKPIMRD